MKKIISGYFIILTISLACLAAGCDDKLKPYDTDTCWLSFDLSSTADTLRTYSFKYAGDEVQKDTVWLEVKTTGFVTGSPRRITLRQIDVETTQPKATAAHYVLFDEPTLEPYYVVPAGTEHTLIPIVLLRDESLEDGDVILPIEITANEDFQPGFKGMSRVYLTISDKVAKPSNWNRTTVSDIAAYSRILHEFLINVTGNNWDFDYLHDQLGYVDEYASGMRLISTNDYYEAAYIEILVKHLQEKLHERNETAGEELEDEEGNVIYIKGKN